MPILLAGVTLPMLLGKSDDESRIVYNTAAQSIQHPDHVCTMKIQHEANPNTVVHHGPVSAQVRAHVITTGGDDCLIRPPLVIDANLGGLDDFESIKDAKATDPTFVVIGTVQDPNVVPGTVEPVCLVVEVDKDEARSYFAALRGKLGTLLPDYPPGTVVQAMARFSSFGCPGRPDLAQIMTFEPDTVTVITSGRYFRPSAWKVVDRAMLKSVSFSDSQDSGGTWDGNTDSLTYSEDETTATTLLSAASDPASGAFSSCRLSGSCKRGACNTHPCQSGEPHAYHSSHAHPPAPQSSVLPTQPTPSNPAHQLPKIPGWILDAIRAANLPDTTRAGTMDQEQLQEALSSAGGRSLHLQSSPACGGPGKHDCCRGDSGHGSTGSQSQQNTQPNLSLHVPQHPRGVQHPVTQQQQTSHPPFSAINTDIPVNSTDVLLSSINWDSPTGRLNSGVERGQTRPPNSESVSSLPQGPVGAYSQSLSTAPGGAGTGAYHVVDGQNGRATAGGPAGGHMTAAGPASRASAPSSVVGIPRWPPAPQANQGSGAASSSSGQSLQSSSSIDTSDGVARQANPFVFENPSQTQKLKSMRRPQPRTSGSQASAGPESSNSASHRSRQQTGPQLAMPKGSSPASRSAQYQGQPRNSSQAQLQRNTASSQQQIPVPPLVPRHPPAPTGNFPLGGYPASSTAQFGLVGYPQDSSIADAMYGDVFTMGRSTAGDTQGSGDPGDPFSIRYLNIGMSGTPSTEWQSGGTNQMKRGFGMAFADEGASSSGLQLQQRVRTT